MDSPLDELLATISDRKIKRKIQKLLGLGEEAVRALGELDAALYLKEDGEAQLQIVADAVLSHFRRLLEYVVMVAPAAPAVESTGDLDLELDAPAPTPRPTPVRGIIAHRERSDEDRWDQLSREMSAFQYGLSQELKEFERRFAHALASDNKEQAVTDLNDATTGLTDGVFAVMTTVYECFLGYAEPERMVPGHRDTLGKALAIRRELAELRRRVRGLNVEVQERSEIAEASYRRIVDLLAAFVESDVFYYLRSDTRRDFWQFAETLGPGNSVVNRNDCEGFDKYLDSLSFVSQRGVLLKHDADLKAKIAAELERAIKFAAVLPEVVNEVIEQSFVKAERLSGLNDDIDALVADWSHADKANALPLCERLLSLVR